MVRESEKNDVQPAGLTQQAHWRTTFDETSKPTEGEVPPAGCAGVVCANETNNKEMFSTLGSMVTHRSTVYV